jgi:hypothetical protein
VANHKADELVDVKVFVREERGVRFVPPQKETPVDISSNGNRDVA